MKFLSAAAQQMAANVDYPEPEKAYWPVSARRGLASELDVVYVYTSQFRECMLRAAERHLSLNVIEEQVLGFTHGDSGRMLCELWDLPQEFAKVAGCRHDRSLLSEAGRLPLLVHLRDLLCRSRSLGYGYEEGLDVEPCRGGTW